MSEANRTPANRREVLLQHLDSVYTLAQALTPDADAAVQLAEATYAHVFAHPETVPAPDPTDSDDDDADAIDWESDKRMLLRQVVALHRTPPDEQDDAAPLDASPRPPALAAFRRQLAERVVHRTLPPVLATLRPEIRVLLLLCYVEDLSCEEAGAVLGMDPDFACRRLEQAQAAVEGTVRADASDRERRLLTALPPGWIRDAFRHVVDTEFGPLPPTVRPTIVAATRQAPERPAQDAEPPAEAPATPPDREATSRLAVQFRRGVFAVLTILTIGLVGYLVTDLLEEEPETNLIVLSAEQSASTDLSYEADSPEEAERWVREHLDWRLTLPTIDEASVQGVSVRSVAPGVDVPVFLYDDATSNQSLALFVYTYALLERHANSIHLAPDIMNQIKGDHTFDLHDLGTHKVLVWRDRDDIFVAVTDADADALRRRIIFPS